MKFKKTSFIILFFGTFLYLGANLAFGQDTCVFYQREIIARDSNGNEVGGRKPTFTFQCGNYESQKKAEKDCIDTLGGACSCQGCVYPKREPKKATSDCETLYDYRDNDLINQWDKASAKYSLSAQAKKDMQKIREKLLEDLESISDPASLKRAAVAAHLKAIASLISNLLDLNPATGAVNGTIQTGKITASQIHAALDAGQKIDSIINGELGKVVAQEFLSHINPVGKGVKAIWDLSEDVKKITDLESERDELRTTIEEQLDSLYEKISEYESQMEESDNKLKTINEIKEAIDTYCKNKSN